MRLSLLVCDQLQEHMCDFQAISIYVLGYDEQNANLPRNEPSY